MPAALAAIVAAQTRGRERFGRMVEFFGGVGKGDAAGYGWTGVPPDRTAAKERNRKARVRVDLADAVGV